MSSRVKDFFKREATLCISAIAALASCIAVPPNSNYVNYFDWRTLALLYCLMVVVSGFCKAGFFNWSAYHLCQYANSSRSIGAILVALSFVSSMLITNDVALLTFIPFALIVLSLAHCENELIIVIVLQTVAANLGSILTPVGNPQNLYLHSYYTIENSVFFGITLPIWLCSALILGLLCLLIPSHKIEVNLGDPPQLQRNNLPIYCLLFFICLLVVFRFLDWYYMVIAIAISLSILDSKTLVKADFMLLLTFICFFIFAGNLSHIEKIDSALRHLLDGRTYLVSLLTSQIISNVPAALLLSGFTSDARSLLLGVDIGGLGTPIASLASLISIKLYTASASSKPGRFLAVFSIVNIAVLIVLSLIFYR